MHVRIGSMLRLPCGSSHPALFPTEALSYAVCKRMAGNGFHLHVTMALFMFTLASCVPIQTWDVERAIVTEDALEEEPAPDNAPESQLVAAT